jgi:hypothetical protein
MEGLLMSEQNVKDRFENEVARLRDLAIRSIDPLVVAKAIAASDSQVQQLILKRSNAGEQLVEVVGWSDASSREVRVFFRFIPLDEIAYSVDCGILALVDSTRGKVAGIIDPYQIQSEHRITRPFVTVSAPDPFQFAVKNDARQKMVEQEDSFFQKLGLSRRHTPVASVYDTPLGTETYSGNNSDDMQTDHARDSGPD